MSRSQLFRSQGLPRSLRQPLNPCSLISVLIPLLFLPLPVPVPRKFAKATINQVVVNITNVALKTSEISPSAANYSPRSRRRRHDRRRASQTDISRSPSPAPSDTTIDLPERFDRYGRRIPERGEDPLADKIEDLLSGKGAAGKFLEKLTGAFGGGSDEDGDGGRRRRRR